MAFAVVEQKEPHAGRMAFADIAQPGTFAERCALARRLSEELEVPLPIYVDGMDDASRALFSDLPSPAFLIDRNGRIADKLPWADPAPLAQALAAVLARDAAVPKATEGTWTIEQREGFARRLLAAGKSTEARAWLDVAATPAPKEAPSPEALARTAVLRAITLRGEQETVRTTAIEAARRLVATAWATDRGRLLAARIELAEAAEGTPLAASLWREAFAELDARAPDSTRQWLLQRLPKQPR